MLATLLVLSLTPSQELPAAAMKELNTLEGKWRVVKFVHPDRETIPDPDDDALIVTFKGRTIDFAGVARGEVVELDPGTDPKCLDFKVLVGSGALKEGSTYESIYKLDGDTLTWAVHIGKGRNRPTAFDQPPTGEMVIVLSRVKE